MSPTALNQVLPSGDARAALPGALERFRRDGVLATPLVFGSHRKAEAVVIPYSLYERLLPAIEDLEVEELTRRRAEEGGSVDLADVAAAIGLDPDEYR
jgi:antitoxin StbD